MKFKENLRFLRRANNMSQNELADKLGYKSFTTVQKWEDGTAFPKVENLNELAKIFEVGLDELLNVDLVTEQQVAVPILGEVKAGYDMFAEQNILGYEYINNEEYKGGEYYYLQIKGDSMINDRIQEGDMVYVRKQDYLYKNEIGIFLVNDNEVTIKRFVPNENGITLVGSNSKYQDRTFKEDEIKILGKVMHLKVKL